MADEPSPPEGASGDEPLEAFYGDETFYGEEAGTAEARRMAAPPSPADGTRWRTPVAGALMAGIAMGLRDVFEPEYHDRTAVEQPAPTQPLEPQKYEVHLDPVAPESSFAIYRPWVDDEPDEPGAAPRGRAGESGGGGMGALGG